MDRIAHLALATPDVVKTANFYKEVFGLVETERKYVPRSGDNPPDEMVDRLYMSDGYMNVTLCKGGRLYHVGAIEGMYHIGFLVDDLDKTWERLQATAFRTLNPRHPQNARAHHELKIRGPQDVIIDLAEPASGWLRGHTVKGVRGTIQHLALGTPDVMQTANFYKEVFGLVEQRRDYLPGSGDNPPDDKVAGVRLTDGYMQVPIRKVRAVPVRSGGIPVGLDHFGFKVDNLEETMSRLEANGATLVYHGVTPGRERVLVPSQAYRHRNEPKYRGPEGVYIDISQVGYRH